MNTAIITLRMSNTLRTAILAASLTIACYANAPAGAQRSEDHFRGTATTGLAEQTSQAGAKSDEAIQPVLLTAPRDTEREKTPQLVAPVCGGSCAVYSPWQHFLAIIHWG